MTKDHAYLYLSSISEAKRQNEVALWRASHLENIACKQAIEEAIRRGFDGMHLSHDCARPGMVWKIERIGMIKPERRWGIRESRIPASSPTTKPMATDTSTYTVCWPMAVTSSVP